MICMIIITQGSAQRDWSAGCIQPRYNGLCNAHVQDCQRELVACVTLYSM